MTTCANCRRLASELRTVTKEREALADLAVRLRTLTAKIPDNPVRLAGDLVDRYNDDSIDELLAEIIRLKS